MFLLALFFVATPLLANDLYDNQKQQWIDKYAVRYGEDVVNTILETKQIISLLSNSDKLSKAQRQNILLAIKRLAHLKTEESLQETQLIERAKVLVPSDDDINHSKILAAILRGILFKNQEYMDFKTYFDIDTQLKVLEDNGDVSSEDYELLLALIDKINLKPANQEIEISLAKMTESEDLKITNNKLNKLNDFIDGLTMIRQVILFNLLNLTKKDILSKLETEFDAFTQGGIGRAVDLNFEIGVGFGDVITIKVSLTPGCFIAVSDDRTITEACKFAIKFSSNVGNEALAKASASINFTGGKERIFFSLTQWLENHFDSQAEAIIAAILAQSLSGSTILQAQKQLKEIEKIEETVLRNQNSLINFLIRHGLVEPGAQYKVRSKEKFIPIDVIRGSVTAAGAITAIDSPLSDSMISASFDSEIKTSIFNRQISLLQFFFSQEKTSDEILAAYQEYIAFPKGSKCRIDAIKANHDDLISQTDVKIINNIANNLKDNLEYCLDALHKEIQSYAGVVNLHDKNGLSASIKEKFEKARKVRGRALMLRSFTYTYIWLRKIYNDVVKIAFKNRISPLIAERFLQIERDLITPTFYIDKDDRLKLSKLQSSSVKVSTFAFGLTIAGRPIEARVTQIIKHPYPDNLGVSLNIKLPGEILFSKDLFHKLLAKIRKYLGSDIEMADDERSLAQIILDPLKTVDIDISLGPVSVRQNTSFELNFIVQGSKLRLQFARQMRSFNVEAKATDVPLGFSTLLLGAGAEITKTDNLLELIGLDTLTYARTIYDASRLGLAKDQDPVDNKMWTNFINKHENELNDIAKSIAKPQSPVREEALSMKEELQATKVKEIALQTFAKLEKNPSLENLTEFFKLYFENVYLNKIDKSYR